MINLVKDTINKDDIDRLIEWLKTYPRLTKGPVTLEIEKKWSKLIGSKYSVFCNSGSSANFLMLHTLIQSGRIKENSRVVVPGLAWATDLAPVMQLGLYPIICDINLEDLSVDLEHLENIFKNIKPSVLILVSVLGLVPNMKRILELCEKYDVILLEDACESMGSKYNNQHLGTFGVMSSFSTYFGHHISTIEGGFVSTDDFELYEILKAVRSHGWDRDLSKDTQKSLRENWEVSDFNSLYTFYYSGLNLRSTDLQAFIGMKQIDALIDISMERNKNFNMYNDLIKNSYWMPPIREQDFVSNFAYPVIHPKRNEIVKTLIENDVEVRPLICGSMGEQPFYVKKYGKLELKNCHVVDSLGFYVPNHPMLSEEEITLISEIIMNHIQ